MTRELTPIQDAVMRDKRDYREIAQLISEEPGHEKFPVKDVERIMEKPGELLLTVLGKREGSFAIGAMIAAKNDPFYPVLGENDTYDALRIKPARLEQNPDDPMRASREIVMSTGVVPSHEFATWMGAGLYEDKKTVLASGNPTELYVGTDEVNEYFRTLAARKNMQKHMRPRLVGALFQVAYLAKDFGAPTPTLPESLHTEHAAARAYYVAAEQRAMAILNAKNAIAALDAQISKEARMTRPDIYFEKTLSAPTSSNVAAARYGLIHPTTPDIMQALESYKKAVAILDSLDPPYDS